MIKYNKHQTIIDMNIICFDTEWLYNNHKKDERFSFNCKKMLESLQDRYDIKTIYKEVLTCDNLTFYMNKFKGKSFRDKYPIVYFSTHGNKHSISMEGEEEEIDLDVLANLVPGFFEGRIVHFSSCCTMKDTQAVLNFKKKSGAILVSGYKKHVDAMDSLVFDMGYFNALQLYSIQTVTKETSRFQKHYASLIDYLQFSIV